MVINPMFIDVSTFISLHKAYIKPTYSLHIAYMISIWFLHETYWTYRYFTLPGRRIPFNLQLLDAYLSFQFSREFNSYSAFH